MNNKSADQDTFRAFQLMTELESGEQLSQRELAGRLGMAVGLVNSYLKNFVVKGWVRVKNYPRNRYTYLLTPNGFAEKSRLAYQHLSYFNNLYTVVRQDYRRLFEGLGRQGVEAVVFCGVDEVAEIAYLSMQESGLALKAVMDNCRVGEDFLGHPIVNISINLMGDVIVVTSLKRCGDILGVLKAQGADMQRVCLPVSAD